MATTGKAHKNYSEADIKHLAFPEDVRTNPAFYIGPPDARGVWTILREVMDNTIDESLAGRNAACHCHIAKSKNGDVVYTVADEGEGIPIKPILVKDSVHGKEHKVSALRAVVSMTRTGGKFGNSAAYKVSRGCFVGSTKIELVDGRTLTFKELYSEFQSGIENYVWTVDRKTGELQAQPIENVQLTKKTQNLVRIRLDNGKSFVCTPDHPLYSTSLQTVAAEDSYGRSLLAKDFAYDRDGYRVSKDRVLRLHRVVAEYYGQDIEHKHVHHIDGDVSNNEPDNLEALSPADHYKEHPEKYDTWMDFVGKTSKLKSRQLSKRNSERWFIEAQLASKVLRVLCRLLSEGKKLSSYNYGAYRGHSYPGVKKAILLLRKFRLKKQAKALILKFSDPSRQNLNVTKRFWDSLKYSIGTSENSVCFDQSDRMNAKRLIGKAVAALTSIPGEGSSPEEFDKCFRPKSQVSSFALQQYIDLDEFVRAVKAGVDPMDFAYRDLSARARSLREHKLRKRIYSEKAKLWGEPATSRLYNDFMRKLNSLADLGLPQTRSVFEQHFANALGNSSWYSGIAACHKRGLKNKKQILQAANSFNHKVVAVERLVKEKPVSVYDLTVPVDHNYRLACGVFVSNTHGLGVKATNALSTYFKVWTRREGAWYSIEYAKGKLIQDVTKDPKGPPKVCGKIPKQGTVIRFIPDSSIFKTQKFPLSYLESWAELACYFTPNFRISFYLDTGKGVKTKEWKQKDGVKALIEELLTTLKCEPLGKSFSQSTPLYDVALAFTDYDGSAKAMQSYVNGLMSMEGGVHLEATYKALQIALKPFQKKAHKFSLHELKEGLVGVINVKLASPQYDSQTKEKLVDDRADGPVLESIAKALQEFFKENKALAGRICDRATALQDLKAKYSFDKKTVKKIETIRKKGFPSKFASASKAPPEKRELFLVEGESAGGCITNSCEVALANGSSISFSQLVQDSQQGKFHKGLAFDGDRGFVPVTLEDPRLTKYVMELIVISTETGTIEATPEHLILTQRGWVQAQYVRSEDSIISMEGRNLSGAMVEHTKVLSVTRKKLSTPVPVYDVSVPNYENFVLASRHVVHNSAKQARDPNYQEILPLRGKIVNALRNAPAKTMASEEIQNLIAVLGFSPQDADPYKTLRVGRVISLVDPDPDGGHIESLIFTFIYKFLPGLYKRGMVYAVVSPEYVAFDKDGNVVARAASKEKIHALAPKGSNIKHIKGWGEMDVDPLTTLAMNPKTRRLVRIMPVQGSEGKEFKLLMGDDVSYRKAFLGVN